MSILYQLTKKNPDKISLSPRAISMLFGLQSLCHCQRISLAIIFGKRIPEPCKLKQKPYLRLKEELSSGWQYCVYGSSWDQSSSITVSENLKQEKYKGIYVINDRNGRNILY